MKTSQASSCKAIMPRGSLLTCCSGNSFLALDTLSQIDGASLIRLQCQDSYMQPSNHHKIKKEKEEQSQLSLLKLLKINDFMGNILEKKKRLLNVQWFTVHIKFNFQRTSWILRLPIQGNSFSRRILNLVDSAN